MKVSEEFSVGIFSFALFALLALKPFIIAVAPKYKTNPRIGITKPKKIIFLGLVIPIFGFVLYLGATAIMKGFSAKSANKTNENIETEKIEETLNEENKLSDEIQKLDQLLKDGVLTQEEFEKAKKKLLDN